MDAKQVTDLFVDLGWLTREGARACLQECIDTEKPIEKVLVDNGLLTIEQFNHGIAESLGTDAADLNAFSASPDVLHLIPAGLARLHAALPVGASGNTIYVCFADPFDTQAAEDLRFALNREIQPMVGWPETVRNLIREHYGSEVTSLDEVMAQLSEGTQVTLDEAGQEEFNAQAAAQEANRAPVIRFVDLILDKAIAARASDIHFEPFETEFKIRYRVDGALYEMDPPPRHLALAVISRVKVMANLNIAERRLPQDGRIQRTVQGKQIDLRVSTLPTSFGESVVLRVLDRSSVNLELEGLGMPGFIYNYILELPAQDQHD